MRDFAERARAALAAEETRYCALVEECMERLASERVDLTDMNRLEMITNGLVLGHGLQLKRDGARGHGFWRIVRQCSYFFWATVLEHAVFYCSRPPSRLDPNDFEDAIICGHIPLAGNWILVTQDATMLEIVNRVALRLAQFYPRQSSRIRAVRWQELQKLQS